MKREDIVARVTSKGVQFAIDCIKGGYEDYGNNEYYGAEAKRDHTASVAATCINCHIVARAKRMSVDIPGFIQIKQKRGRTTFILADHTEIWFKKLDKDAKPRYRDSKQAAEYLKPKNEQLLLEMAMPPEKERWVAGYRSSSPADTEYEIIVAGPQKDGKFWEVGLLGTEIQELFPATETESVPAATAEVIKKRVQIRKTKAKE